jgi:hypothetical protein
MSDKLQRPQSAYHGADPALANRWPNPVQTGRASAKDFLQPARIEDEGFSRQIRTESSPFGEDFGELARHRRLRRSPTSLKSRKNPAEPAKPRVRIHPAPPANAQLRSSSRGRGAIARMR